MGPDPGLEPFRAEDIAAAFAWWADAGVDLDFADKATDWLPSEQGPVAPVLPAAFTAPRAEAPTPDAASVRIGGPRADWPADLSAFTQWWLAEPSLDGGQVRARLSPLGPAGADLMVVVPAPGPDDADRLLEGPEGSLLAAMLAAMGFDPEQVYLAAALPRAMPVPDWASLQANGLGEVLAHHIGLVAPKRLILFGSNILPLLGHDPAQIAKPSLAFNQQGQNVPLMAALDLGTLASRPARKAHFWQRWLEFSGSKFSAT